MSYKMKAMIFAAGLGTRLRPLTDTLPKALIPICDKPLIEHIARKIWKVGIDEIVVNVHYFADKIEQWIENQAWTTTSRAKHSSENLLFEISDERNHLLETGGAVLNARSYLEGTGNFMIHNVDVLSDCNLGWLVEQMPEGALATLLVSQRKTSRYFLFRPEDMRLVGWVNRTTGETKMISDDIKVDDCIALAFAGIHILNDSVFDIMEEYVADKGLSHDADGGVRFPITDFYLWSAAKYPIYGAFAENLQFIDVGKLDALQPAEDFVKSQGIS